MPTSYPASIDTYNNPTKWNPAPTHDGTGEHSNAYDAIEAIETFIGTTGSPNFATSGGGTAIAISTKTIGYTFTLADEGSEVDYNSSSAGTFTIPTNTSVAFPVGTVISCRQIGTGQLTIAPISGVTLNNGSGLYVTRAQYSLVTLTKGATNTWYLDGDV